MTEKPQDISERAFLFAVRSDLKEAWEECQKAETNLKAKLREFAIRV